MAQRPHPLGVFAGRAIGYACFAQMPVGGAETLVDVAGRQGCKGLEEPGPDRARRAALGDEFFGKSGQANIVAGPLRHAPIARTGFCALTASVTASLAGVSRHPCSPP